MKAATQRIHQRGKNYASTVNILPCSNSPDARTSDAIKEKRRSRLQYRVRAKKAARRLQFISVVLLAAVDVFWFRHILAPLPPLVSNDVEEGQATGEVQKSLPLSASQSWDSCREYANIGIKPLQRVWIGARVPVFTGILLLPRSQRFSANTSDWQYHAIFNTRALKTTTAEQYAMEAKWTCDGKAATVIGSDPKTDTLVLLCPQSPVDANARVQEIRVKEHEYNVSRTADCELHSLKKNQDQRQQQQEEQGRRPKYAVCRLKEQVYNVSSHADCELQSLKKNHDQRQQQQEEQGRRPKYAVCSMVWGSAITDGLVKPWIYYHRILGFDMFYIYIKEPYNETTMQDKLPSLPYVKYIPFDIDANFVNDYGTFFHQPAQMLECIYRTRAISSLLWVASMDVDEFFQVMSPKPTNSSINIPDIVRLLEPVEKASDFDSLGGWQVLNVFFGSGVNNGTDITTTGLTKTPLLLDYVYRASLPTELGREKVIGRPWNIRFFATHKISDGGAMYRPDPNTEIRLAHFKLANKGVFFYKQRKDTVMKYPQVERDTKLRDGYREGVLRLMNGSPEK